MNSRRIGLAALGAALVLVLARFTIDPLEDPTSVERSTTIDDARPARLPEAGGRARIDLVPEPESPSAMPGEGGHGIREPSGLWILDANSGRPVEGATVALTRNGWVVGTTGVRGHVDIRDVVLDPGRLLRARVECEGYLPAAIHADFSRTTEAFGRVWPGVTMLGFVRSIEGEPLGDVDVKLLCNTKGGPALEEYLSTDALGRFETWAPASSRVTVILRRMGYAQFVKAIEVTVDREEFDFEIAPARPFSGRVVDALTGQGVEGIALQPLSSAGATTSGPEGWFELELDPRASARVSASHVDYTRVDWDAVFEEQPATLPLMPLLDFSGVLVRPPEAGPLPKGWEHAEVLVRREGSLGENPWGLIESCPIEVRGISNPRVFTTPMHACFLDAEGRFEGLKAVPSDIGLTAMVIGHTGWTTSVVLPLDLTPGETHWIEFPDAGPPRTVLAEVRNVDSELLPHIEVEARCPSHGTVGTGRVDGNRVTNLEFLSPCNAVTFSVVAIQSGRRLELPSHSIPKNVLEGSTDDVEIELEWEFEAVEGHVRFEDGNPVVGGRVWVRCHGAEWVWATTSDAEGAFKLVIPKGFDGEIEAESGLLSGGLRVPVGKASGLMLPVR